MKYSIFVIPIIAMFIIQAAYGAEQIPISKSVSMGNVIWNGKWTFYDEWKDSSLYSLSYDDGTTMQLRTAHQGNSIYILIDAVHMTQYNKGSDKAIVCFDTKDDKSKFADGDDYCFGVALGDNNAFVLRGGSPLEQTDHFTNIANPGVIGVAAISDENDHYSSIPHSSYEFKIPTNLIGRSDIYGFYLGIYDSHAKKIYAFPENLTSSYYSEIPSPSKWGEIISPDKSLPEFPLPLVTFLIAFTTLILITKPILRIKSR